MSNAVSGLVLLLISLDRFLAYNYPICHISLADKARKIVCGLIWVFGTVLAMMPFTNSNGHIAFHETTGACIPIPISTNKKNVYSFGILFMTFLIFLLTANMQLMIYLKVRNIARFMDKTKCNVENARLTKNIMSIVVTDFLCWVPVGLLGLLAWRGMAVPGEVNVAVVTFVMPLNSALNPMLYNLNIYLEKKRQQRTTILLERIRIRLKNKMDCKTKR